MLYECRKKINSFGQRPILLLGFAKKIVQGRVNFDFSTLDSSFIIHLLIQIQCKDIWKFQSVISYMSCYSSTNRHTKIKISSYPTQNLIVFLFEIVRHNNERNSYVSNNKQNLKKNKKINNKQSNPTHPL